MTSESELVAAARAVVNAVCRDVVIRAGSAEIVHLRTVLKDAERQAALDAAVLLAAEEMEALHTRLGDRHDGRCHHDICDAVRARREGAAP